jgi:flavin reductase (DIM6/NTAB) family NADH-FMN oxidoreductase RutF
MGWREALGELDIAYPVREALAVLECVVRRALDDVGGHIVFLAEVVRARCQGKCFDEQPVIDVLRAHPVMHLTGPKFSQCASMVTANAGLHAEWVL